MTLKRLKLPIALDNLASLTNTWGNGEAGGLVITSMLVADGLAYLSYVDEETFGTREKAPPSGWEQAIDVAHPRWAAISAITALDLAAGALGRLHCPAKRTGREYSLRELSGKHGLRLRTKLTMQGRKWVEQTWSDPEYQTVRRTRNPFTHGRMREAHYVSVGRGVPKNHANRTGFYVGPNNREVRGRDLIEMACGVVERRLGAFLAETIAGTLV